MVNHIRIRHCKLCLRRTGGWSWGPDPNRLLGLATQALPELIASELMRLLGNQQVPLTIDWLSIKIPIKLSVLTEFTDGLTNYNNHLVVSERISQQLKQALALQAGIDYSAIVEPDESKHTSEITQPFLAPLVIKDSTTLLVDWYIQGTLLQRLKHFDYPTLIEWEMLALNSLPESVRLEKKDQHLFMEAEQFSHDFLRSFLKPSMAKLKRLVLIVALLQKYPKQLSKQILVDLLKRITPGDANGTDASEQSNLTSSQPLLPSADTVGVTNISDLPRSVRKNIPATARVKTHTNQSSEFQVSSVLPFVSVGILSRLSYFDVLATAFKAANVESDIHYFAAALAYKMLGEPHRGWHRTPVDMNTAAALAGLNQAIPGEEIDHFAFSCRHCLSPADAHLKLLLTQGHDPSYALLIHPCKIEKKLLWLLMDTQGCFPLGWFSDRTDLLQTLEDFAGNTFLISEIAEDPALFTDLSSQHHRFITTLPPARNDKWRSIDRRRQFWTNDLDAQSHWLLKQSQCLPAVTEAAESITHSLIHNRPIIPASWGQAYALQFEKSLALAASSALATIAWQLWGDKETTDPLLALQRLRNLEGKVIISSEKITVRPLLGRRYQDLYSHNFFVDVINLPWLKGRRLEFAGL